MKGKRLFLPLDALGERNVGVNVNLLTVNDNCE